MLGLEKSSGEAYPPSPETPEQPRETAVERETREVVDESNKASLMVHTTFSRNGWISHRLSRPGATTAPASPIPQQDKRCALTAKTTARNSVTDRLSKIEKPGPIFLSKRESLTKREHKIFVCLDI